VVANFQPDPKNYGLPTGTDNGESLFNHQTQPSAFSFSKVLGRDIRSFHNIYIFIIIILLFSSLKIFLVLILI